MNFRLLTAKEYPRWYHDQLSEAFVRRNASLCPINSPSAGGRTLRGMGDCLTEMSC